MSYSFDSEGCGLFFGSLTVYGGSCIGLSPCLNMVVLLPVSMHTRSLENKQTDKDVNKQIQWRKQLYDRILITC